MAGAALMWPRTERAAAAALTVLYALITMFLLGVPFERAHFAEYGTYSNAAEQLALGAAALILYAGIDGRPTRPGQMIFGLCAVLFGGAHFAYMNLTVPLIPKFLQPSPVFWAYATGIGHIAAGIAILIRVRARLAAILLTAMYASFTPLVHLPMLFADPANHYIWNENALNLALTGAAWVVADSLRPRRVATQPDDAFLRDPIEQIALE